MILIIENVNKIINKLPMTIFHSINFSKNITIRGVGIHQNDFPYTLESDDWKQIQIEGLKQGYESRSMR